MVLKCHLEDSKTFSDIIFAERKKSSTKGTRPQRRKTERPSLDQRIRVFSRSFCSIHLIRSCTRLYRTMRVNSSCVSILAFLALFKGAAWAEDDKVTYGADIVRARFDSLVMMMCVRPAIKGQFLTSSFFSLLLYSHSRCIIIWRQRTMRGSHTTWTRLCRFLTNTKTCQFNLSATSNNNMRIISKDAWIFMEKTGVEDV